MAVLAHKPGRSAVRGWVQSGLLPPSSGYDPDRWPAKPRAAAYLLAYLVDHTNMKPAAAAPVACCISGMWTAAPVPSVNGDGLSADIAPGVRVVVYRQVLAACGVPGYEAVDEPLSKTPDRSS